MANATQQIEEACLAFKVAYRDILLCRRPPLVCMYGLDDSGKSQFANALLDQWAGKLINMTLISRMHQTIPPETLQPDRDTLLILEAWDVLPSDIQLHNVYAHCKQAGSILVLLGQEPSVLHEHRFSLPAHAAVFALGEECHREMEPPRPWGQSVRAALSAPSEAYQRLVYFYADYRSSRRVDRLRS